ncbi:MAG TPA: 2-amino-4-hydroxy-6-hydroxymethyldihydropteridine diphosphokinase [Bryobacteraceae bacterium]
MKTIYLSLGSNLGDREAQLRDAIRRLEAAEVCVLRRSPVFETEPQDVPGQGWFLNAVVEAETALFPLQLLSRTQAIEHEMGRRRLMAGGPRNIDIDILLYGKFAIRTPQLEIPHPRLGQRRFVLEPLAALSPELRHPVTGRTVREMLNDVQDQQVVASGVIL